MLFPYGTTREQTKTPFMTLGLVGMNVLVGIWFWLLPEVSKEVTLYDLAVIPEQFHPVSLLTSMFMHGNFAHIFGNMWFLWVFGKSVEDGVSEWEYILVYIGAGFVGASLHTLTCPAYRQDIPCVGASGAIAGVMGAFLVMYPKERIKGLLGFWPVQLPASLYLVWYFVIQLFHGVIELYDVKQLTSGIAFWAHIGGFIVGFVGIGTSRYRENFIALFRKQKSRSQGIDASAAFREGRFADCKQSCHSILKRTPNDRMARFLLSRMDALQGNTQRAVKILNAIRSEVMSSRDYPAVSTFYIQMKKLGAADSFNASELLKAGIALRELGYPGEALTPLMNAVKLEDAEELLDLLLFQLGECVSELGDRRKGAAIMRRLVEWYPHSNVATMAKFSLQQ